MRLISATVGTAAALIFGAVACDLILYGPSLAGQRILAPTDLLLLPGVLGRDPRFQDQQPQNRLLADPVEVIYPYMTFAAREVRAGRLPLWNPYAYCGSPFLANHQSSVFSPLSVLFYLWPDPRMLAWIHLVKALVAASGTYMFLRRVGTSRWASVVGALSFAHCGFFVAWLNFPLSSCAVWLPWTFLATESVVRCPAGWGGPGLAAMVGLLIHSGHLETAAHILSATAFYGAWRWIELYRRAGQHRSLVTVLGVGVAAGILGLALGSLQLLPAREYLDSSLQMAQRTVRSPASAPCDRRAELLRLAFPYLLGTWQRDSHPVVPLSFNESSANGYLGFTFLALMAPLGIANRWRSSATWCWVILGLLAAAPMFRVPGLELWARVPPFDLMRNNRMLLITGWSVLVLGAQGLDALVERRGVSFRAGVVSALLAAVCVVVFSYVLIAMPPTLLTSFTQRAWPWFRGHILEYIAICVFGCLFMVLWLWKRDAFSSRFAQIGLGLLAIAELVVGERGYNPQVDPATYYPPREFVRYVADRVEDGRICGLNGVITPNIGMMYGLRDVRGYDAVDPLPYLELLRAANPNWEPRSAYAVTRNFSSGPSPVLDMLSVRYVVSTRRLETTTWDSVHQSEGIWVYRNPSALPRVYVPRRATVVANSEDRLRMLADPGFDPAEVVLITEPTQLGAESATATAQLLDDEPCRVRIQARAETPSIVVLADAWSPGWSVFVDGQPARALQANHALRAVQVAAGEHVVEWSYFPSSVRAGLWVSGVSSFLISLWCIVQFVCKSRRAAR